MRVISFHADGIHSAAEKGFFDWATAQEADFICVQNLGCSEYDLQSDVFFPADYNAYFFDAVEGKRDGVALYCRQLPKAIMTGLGFSDFDMEGRYIQADYGNVSVGCLLVPAGGEPGSDAQARKLEFLALLQNHLAKIRNKRREFIICGGWQIAHTAIDVQDTQQNSGRLTEERQWMDETLELGYVDAFREVNSDQDEFSWWPDTEGNLEQPRDRNGLRTDLQVVSAGMKYVVEYGAIYKGQVFASHAPLIMDYDLEPVAAG